MEIKENLKKIIEKDGHYLAVLNEINSFLYNDEYVTYSAFYFHRGEKDYLVASVGEWTMVGTIKIELYKRDKTLLGYWLIETDIPTADLEEIASLMTKKIFFEEWEQNYAFTQNRSCEYFPCHKIKDENSFNCLFCYCPLYLIPECGGNFTLLKNGVKDCSNCLLPHRKESYDYIISKLISYQNIK
jgi:hypothetical protein